MMDLKIVCVQQQNHHAVDSLNVSITFTSWRKIACIPIHTQRKAWTQTHINYYRFHLMALTRMDTRKCLQSSTMFNAYLHRRKHIHTHTHSGREAWEQNSYSPAKKCQSSWNVFFIYSYSSSGFFGKRNRNFHLPAHRCRSFDQISEIFGSHDRFSINENGC